MRPVNWLCATYKYSIWVKWRSVSNVPVNWFDDRATVTSRDSVPKLGGNDPVNRFCSNPITSKSFQFPIMSGIGPVKWFWFIFKYNREFQFSKVVGKVPVISFSGMAKSCNDVKNPNSNGNDPYRWLFGKKIAVTSPVSERHDTPMFTFWSIKVGTATTLDHWHSDSCAFMKLYDSFQVALLWWLLALLLSSEWRLSPPVLPLLLSTTTWCNRPPVAKKKTAKT